MQAALREVLQGVSPLHVEAGKEAGPPADLCPLPSAAQVAGGRIAALKDTSCTQEF